MHKTLSHNEFQKIIFQCYVSFSTTVEIDGRHSN